VKAKRAGKYGNTQLRNESKGEVLKLESTRGRPLMSATAWAGSIGSTMGGKQK